MRTINTTRFGNIEINQEHLIRFRDGMIGFKNLKEYVLVESPAMPLVLWLQAVDAPDIAFPLMEPWFFKRDFKLQMTDADRIAIDLKDNNRLKEFVVLTLPEDITQMTANIKAPVIVNLSEGLGGQVIIQDKNYELRKPAYQDFQNALSSLKEESVTDSWSAVSIKDVVSSSRGTVSPEVQL